MNHQFETVIPLQLIKGKDSKGKALMKMEGIASTPSLDSDGEHLDPKGFDTDYFLKYGFMNWNHQTNQDPLAVVGKPTEASVDNKSNFKIGFNLFPDSAKAVQIFELQQILEKQGMALGLSIEGKVIERDKKDPRIVTKAQITGCAITPNPKNQDTIMSIIKGQNFNKLSAYEDASVDEREKALSVNSSSGMAVSKESLHRTTVEEEGVDGSKKISKGKFFEKIFRDLPSISIKGAQSLYNLTQKIEKSITMSQQKQDEFVSEEAISKALETLGLQEEEGSATEGQEPIVADAEGEQEPVTEETDAQKLEKALATIEELKKGGMSKKMSKSEEDEKDKKDEEGDDEDDIEKAKKKKADVQTPPTTEVKKGEDQTEALLKGMTDLFKSEREELSKAYDSKFGAIGTLVKGLSDQNVELMKRLDVVEGSSQGRKSITTKNYVEKSFGQEDELSKGQRLQSISISQNKRQVLDVLTKSITGEAGITDQNMASQIMAFEQAGVLSKGIIEKAQQLGYNLVK